MTMMIRALLLFVFIFFAAVVINCSSDRKNDSTKSDENNLPQTSGSQGTKQAGYAAYYFHPEARCETCLNIEAFSKEAVEIWEKNNHRKVSWSAINIEDSANEHFRNDFELRFSSLVFAELSEGRTVRWKNLENIWELANDRNSFISYVTKELDQFINE